MTSAETVWLAVGVGLGALLAYAFSLNATHWRQRERSELIREVGNYKGMVEHLLAVQKIGAQALDLADRELSVLKKGI